MDRINVGEYPHDMDCGRKEEQGKILIIDRASIFDYSVRRKKSSPKIHLELFFSLHQL